MILLFNLQDHPSRETLEGVFRLKKAEFRHVPAEEFTLPLSQLALPSVLRRSNPLFYAPETPAFSDPMIVFAGLSNETVNELIDLLNRSGAPRIPLKAVLTPTSRDWTPVYLHEHLKAEHEAYETWKKQQKR